MREIFKYHFRNMTPVVKAKLDSILNYPFFTAVGQPLPSTVSSVNTWPKAARTCGFVKWSNSQLQVRNSLQRGITDQFPQPGMWERSEEWNPLCEELRPLIVSFVGGLVRELPLNDNDRKKVRDNINWDVLLICLETHYQDIVKPIFYIPHLDPWYAAGHYPCGWDGVLRGGQLIVF